MEVQRMVRKSSGFCYLLHVQYLGLCSAQMRVTLAISITISQYYQQLTEEFPTSPYGTEEARACLLIDTVVLFFLGAHS